jgi:hypothetical protein
MGYAPQIEEWSGGDSSIFHQFSKAVIRAKLRKYYQPLTLDAAGRCDECAAKIVFSTT